jgi:hypothetical protein
LGEAVRTVVAISHLTTIIVGEGKHKVEERCLAEPIKLVGDPEVAKEKIVVIGGIYLMKGIQGNCHLQHMTLRQAKGDGVYGLSSFTMEDVIVERCGGDGVVASGTGIVGRCTNVEVRQCGKSGVFARNGASITLIGTKTAVHDNCTKGKHNDYGLIVAGAFSIIQLVSPLTKEQVSTHNGGGSCSFNWGVGWYGTTYVNQIKTIADMSSPASVVASGETKTTNTSSLTPSE